MTAEGRLQGRVSYLLTASGGGAQRAFSGVLILLLVAIASRAYGARAAGIVGIATTLALVGVSLADFGMTTFSLREFARKAPDRVEFWSLVRGKVVIAIIVAAALAGGSLAAGPDLALATSIGVSSLPFTAITMTATSLLIVQRRGLPLATAASAGLLAGVGTALLLASTDAPVEWIAIALPVARFVELAVLMRTLALESHPQGRRDFGIVTIMRQWPLAGQGVLQMLYQRSTILVAGWVLGTVGAGVVTQGVSVLSAIGLIPSVLATVAFPRLVVDAREDVAKTLRSLGRYAAVGVLMISPFVAVLLVRPDLVLSALYGEASGALETFTRWVAVTLLLVCPNSLITYLFFAFDRERLLMAVSVLTAVGSTVLVFVGAHAQGITGVGWSLFASEVLTTACFACAWFASRGAISNRQVISEGS